MSKMHRAFEGLSHIRDTRRFNEQSDGKCCSALYDHFSRHDMYERFDMTLLHTHFPLYGGEIIISQFHSDTRTIIGEAYPADEAPKVLPWAFRLFEPSRHEFYMPYQYVAVTPEIAAYDLTINERDAEFLAGLRSILHAHHALDRFGVQLHIPLLDAGPGEHLMEHTDDENRRSTLTFVGEDEYRHSPYFETSWRFVRADRSFASSQKCWFLCCRGCYHGSSE